MVSSAVSSRALAGSLGEPVSSDDSGCRDSSIRKRIEEPFGWIKITAAVYNLLRITTLDTQPA